VFAPSDHRLMIFGCPNHSVPCHKSTGCNRTANFLLSQNIIGMAQKCRLSSLLEWLNNGLYHITG